MPRILIVDDDDAVCASLALLLKQAGFETRSCNGPAQALAQLAAAPFDAVLQDMNFSQQTSGQEGLQLLHTIRQQHPNLPVLLMTAWGSIELAVQGVKAGAAHFFSKPWENGPLLELIRTTLALAQDPQPRSASRTQLDATHDFTGIVGEHPKLLQVLDTVGRVARTRAPVLILGESGTGKELIADAIHRNSERASGPLLKINMGAIAPQLFESELFGHVKGAFTDARADRAGHLASARGGTLFLDEVGELQRPDQVKLLRVLQDQSYLPVGASRPEQADVRVVSATNRELAEQVASGAFREDLFYRLNLITLRLPPLRERRSDIPLLAHALSRQVAQHYGMPIPNLQPAAVQWLSQQLWPGNIRQLKQTLERALLLAAQPELTLADLLAHHPSDGNAHALGVEGLTLEQVERLTIAKAMAQHQGNVSQAARGLGLSRAALYRRLERHGLSAAADDTAGDDDA
jgi:two-component system, NtrC family, response regulator